MFKENDNFARQVKTWVEKENRLISEFPEDLANAHIVCEGGFEVVAAVNKTNWGDNSLPIPGHLEILHTIFHSLIKEDRQCQGLRYSFPPTIGLTPGLDLPDILRYELQVSLQDREREFRKAVLFRDEMIVFLRENTEQKLAPLELGEDQLRLFELMFKHYDEENLQPKDVCGWMEEKLPIFFTEWNYLPPADALDQELRESGLNPLDPDGAEIIRLEKSINRNFDLLLNQLAVVVKWGMLPDNVPSFRLFGMGFFSIWASDVTFLALPKIPETLEEAKDYYSKAFSFETPRPLFWTLDDWQTIGIDWRDTELRHQPIRHQILYHIGQLQSLALDRQLEIYATQDVSGLRRRFIAESRAQNDSD